MASRWETARLNETNSHKKQANSATVQNINPVQTTARSPTESKCICVGVLFTHLDCDPVIHWVNTTYMIERWCETSDSCLTIWGFSLRHWLFVRSLCRVCLCDCISCISLWIATGKGGKWRASPNISRPNCLQGSDALTKLVLWTGEVPNANKPKTVQMSNAGKNGGVQHNVDMNDKIFCMVFLEHHSLFMIFVKAGVATKTGGAYGTYRKDW